VSGFGLMPLFLEIIMAEEKKKPAKKKPAKKSSFEACKELLGDLNKYELKLLEGLIKDVCKAK